MKNSGPCTLTLLSFAEQRQYVIDVSGTRMQTPAAGGNLGPSSLTGTGSQAQHDIANLEVQAGGKRQRSIRLIFKQLQLRRYRIAQRRWNSRRRQPKNQATSNGNALINVTGNFKNTKPISAANLTVNTYNNGASGRVAVLRSMYRSKVDHKTAEQLMKTAASLQIIKRGNAPCQRSAKLSSTAAPN